MTALWWVRLGWVRSRWIFIRFGGNITPSLSRFLCKRVMVMKHGSFREVRIPPFQDKSGLSCKRFISRTVSFP